MKKSKNKEKKTKKKQTERRKQLQSGDVVDGNKILDSNTPLKDGDVINWNEYDYI